MEGTVQMLLKTSWWIHKDVGGGKGGWAGVECHHNRRAAAAINGEACKHASCLMQCSVPQFSLPFFKC